MRTARLLVGEYLAWPANCADAPWARLTARLHGSSRAVILRDGPVTWPHVKSHF